MRLVIFQFDVTTESLSTMSMIYDLIVWCLKLSTYLRFFLPLTSPWFLPEYKMHAHTKEVPSTSSPPMKCSGRFSFFLLPSLLSLVDN
jgi:hypothetical protein